MKTFGALNTTAVRAMTGVMAMAVMVAVTGCADKDYYIEVEKTLEDMGLPLAEQQQVHEAWRVDMIVTSDMSNDMLAEYSYDESNRLIKSNVANRSKGNRIIDTRTESRFEWENNLISKQLSYSRYQDYSFGYDYENNSETLYGYDAEGRLLPWDNDNWYGDREYKYDEAGRLVQTYSYEFEGMTYKDRLEWDENGNVIRQIVAGPEYNMIEEPIPGTYMERIFEFEYDNHPKPNFGVGGALFWDGRFNPWPMAGNAIEQMARTLSHNNLTRSEQSGYAYRYTYNDDGLPATVQTIWLGIETLEPMVQTIVYKRVAE